MIACLFDIFFGCWHRSYTFPITRDVPCGVWSAKQTYVVCLDCGAEFHYDLRTMRLGRKIQRPVLQPDQVTEARRLDDDRALAGPTRQEPLQKTVLTIERKKA